MLVDERLTRHTSPGDASGVTLGAGTSALRTQVHDVGPRREYPAEPFWPPRRGDAIEPVGGPRLRRRREPEPQLPGGEAATDAGRLGLRREGGREAARGAKRGRGATGDNEVDRSSNQVDGRGGARPYW